MKMSMTKLPLKICVLDLETQKTDFKSPEKCELALVGTKIYILQEKEYQPQEYMHFLPDQMQELEQFLREFDGIIIGHNILNFDYRVLRPLISLKDVIEKTVDTLAFLYKLNTNQLRGLSLDALAQLNFGKSKTISGGNIPELWQQGQYQEVIKYNENDCALTMELWWQLVKKRSIRVEQK